MKTLKRIWADVKAGRNITLYLTIVTAIILPALRLFSGVGDSYLGPLTLAALGVLAGNLLAVGHQIQEGFNALEIGVGATSVYSQFPDALFSDQCRASQKEIRILQTYIPGPKPVPDGLIAVARAGCMVRILLLDPETAAARQRMDDIGFQGNTARLFVAAETLIKTLSADDLHRNVDVRLYNSLPSFSMFAADDFLLLGLFWFGQENMGAPHVALHARASEFGKSMIETFERMWSTAKPAMDCPWWAAKAGIGTVRGAVEA